MPRQVLFYGSVDNFNVASFLQSLDAAKQAREDIKMKLNSEGGDVMAGWGWISEFRDFEFEKEIEVHGQASSMAAVFLLFATRVTAIQQSTFLLHRASSFFSDGAVNTILKNINDEFRKAFDQKIDKEAFEEIAGVTVERFFDSDQDVIDVPLNSEEALRIGLITDIKQLNANEMTALNEVLVTAGVDPIKEVKVKTEKEEKKKKDIVPQKSKPMNENELRANHPELWNAIYNQGMQAGQEAERDRAGAWLAFVDVDPKTVVEGVEAGKPISQTAMAKFTRLAMDRQHGKDLTADSSDNIPNADSGNPAAANHGADAGKSQDNPSTEKPEVAAFEADVLKNLGVSTKPTLQ